MTSVNLYPTSNLRMPIQAAGRNVVSPASKRWMLFFMSQKVFEELVPSNLSTSETNTRYAYFHQTMYMHATSLGALL